MIRNITRFRSSTPLTGTGTFLASVIKHIHKRFEGQQGIWDQYVDEHLIPRLNGFELLMASYAMAHLKLDLLLTETGYKSSPPYEGGVAGPTSFVGADGVVLSDVVETGAVVNNAENHPPAKAVPLLRKEGSQEKKRLRVEQTAQAILDARTKFPDATLADLYDPLTMPKELLDAHRANDEAVDACYGTKRFKNELERLEFLFDLYRQYTEPLAIVGEKEARRIRRKKGET